MKKNNEVPMPTWVKTIIRIVIVIGSLLIGETYNPFETISTFLNF